MFSDSGQCIKTSLDDTNELIEILNNLTANSEKYDFNKEYNYISENKIENLPEYFDFTQVRVGVYQKIIEYGEFDYKEILNNLNFKTENEISNVKFDKQTVIITVAQYDINNIEQNIGNINYDFGDKLNEYTVNLFVVSKIVNINCIYYNNIDENVGESTTSTELDEYVKAATSGIITSISEDRIEIGLNKDLVTHIAKIDNETQFKNYETNEKINISDLNIGDSIYVLGETAKNEGNLEVIDATDIDICPKDKVKGEIEKYLIDTYRIDGMGIEYSNVDSSGNGYIIITCNYDNFIYPIKLNVNSQTETFLGRGYHLQSNYGYVLHEICDITLDTKITDIDNIKGLVKTIEYIAD